MCTPEDRSPSLPRRILVAGVSGVGKTTLARQVAAVLGVPHVEIDALFHGPDWTPREQFLADVRELARREAWITEWQYSSARPLLAARADLMVWLDLPYFSVALPRVVRRTVRRRVRRDVLWNGNVEPPLWTFLTNREHIVRWSFSTRNTCRALMSRLERERPDLPVVRLRSSRDVIEWRRALASLATAST